MELVASHSSETGTHRASKRGGCSGWAVGGEVSKTGERREQDLIEHSNRIGCDKVPELLQRRPHAICRGLREGLAVLGRILSLVVLLEDHKTGGVGPVVGKDGIRKTQNSIREEAGAVLKAYEDTGDLEVEHLHSIKKAQSRVPADLTRGIVDDH